MENPSSLDLEKAISESGSKRIYISESGQILFPQTIDEVPRGRERFGDHLPTISDLLAICMVQLDKTVPSVISKNILSNLPQEAISHRDLEKILNSDRKPEDRARGGMVVGENVNSAGVLIGEICRAKFGEADSEEAGRAYRYVLSNFDEDVWKELQNLTGIPVEELLEDKTDRLLNW